VGGETEKLRWMPSETMQDLISAGLMRVGSPQQFGGDIHDDDVSFDMVMEPGRGRGLTASIRRASSSRSPPRIHHAPLSMVTLDGYVLRFNKSSRSANGL